MPILLDITLMISVAKLVIKREEKWLLIQRSDSSKFFPSQWDLPGGKLNEGETAFDAVIREVKEETSLNVAPDVLVLEEEIIENNTPIHYSIFTTKEFKGTVQLSKDHQAFAWLTNEQIRTLRITPFVRQYFFNHHNL
jgi:8-oxo-dGTP diphosphatase